jgi:hypothetical protein
MQWWIVSHDRLDRVENQGTVTVITSQLLPNTYPRPLTWSLAGRSLTVLSSSPPSYSPRSSQQQHRVCSSVGGPSCAVRYRPPTAFSTARSVDGAAQTFSLEYRRNFLKSVAAPIPNCAAVRDLFPPLRSRAARMYSRSIWRRRRTGGASRFRECTRRISTGRSSRSINAPRANAQARSTTFSSSLTLPATSIAASDQGNRWCNR